MISTAWTPGLKGGRGPLRILPGVLFRTERIWLQLIVAWALALGGSILLGAAINALVPHVRQPDFGNASSGVVFTLIVLFSPIVETIMMGAVVALLMRWLRTWQAVLASALMWGVLHSLSAPTWGLVIWWPFLIFSTVFATWRPNGFWRAVALVAVIHMAQNVGPAAAIVWNR